MGQRKDDLAAWYVLHGRKGATALTGGSTIATVCTGVLEGMCIPVNMSILVLGMPEAIPVSMVLHQKQCGQQD